MIFALVAALTVGTVMPAQQPSADDQRITICVAAQARDGFVDIDKAIHDSIEDLRDNLKKKKGLRLVTDPAAADIVLRVIAREVVSQPAGAMAMPLGSGVVAVPLADNQKVVYTVLEVGEYRKDFNAATAGYGDSAEEIARQVKVWVDSNRTKLLDDRATRVRATRVR